MKNKKGVEWEIIKMIIMVLLIVLLVGATILLFGGKGNEIFAGIKNLFRMGRA